MRSFIVLFAAAAIPAFCQNQSQSFNPNLSLTLSQPTGICSIPLLEAKPAAKTIPMPRLTPLPAGKTPLKEMSVTPPAPACRANTAPLSRILPRLTPKPPKLPKPPAAP
jgi:hypothetical protein